MIKANELRIGNLISFDGKQFDADTLDIKNLSNPRLKVSNKLYEPIPLTEEWLLKFGFWFDRTNEEYREEDSNLYLAEVNSSEWYDNNLGVTLKHVHQLQNLYFALTGEELTIK